MKTTTARNTDGQTVSEPAHEIMVWSYRRQANAQASLRIRAVSPELSLVVHIQYGKRRRVRPNIRYLAPLHGCAYAFEEWVYGGRNIPYSHKMALSYNHFSPFSPGKNGYGHPLLEFPPRKNGYDFPLLEFPTGKMTMIFSGSRISPRKIAYPPPP